MGSKSWAIRLLVVGLLATAGTGLTALPASAGTGTPTSLDSSQNPSPACGSVTFKATVFGLPFPDNPEGLVQFFDGLSTLAGPQVITPDFDTFLGVHDVPTDHSSVTITVPLSGGTHIITFGYGGTAGLATGGPLTQTVTAATSTTAVTSSVNPTVFGQPTQLHAAVTSSCSGSVAGSVQFVVDGANFGPSQLVDSGGHASLTTADLPVGNHPVSAVFTSSSSDVQGSTGILAGGQTVHPADTSTSVNSSANPSEYGASVGFTATTGVVPPGAGAPTGSTQFTDNGFLLGTGQSVNGAGQATVTTNALTVGTHTISAGYSSDTPNFNGSSGSLFQVVNRARTTLTYDGMTSQDYNDPATLSATLTRSDNGAPIPAKPVTLTMGAETCSAATAVNGQASCSITPSEPGGPYTVSAGFAGDGNYLPSAQNVPFTVTREETTTIYTGPTVIAQNNPVTLSGRLLEDGTTPIAGRALTLTLGSGASSQTCTTPATDSSGSGRCTITNVTVGQGPQPVRADFAGDSFYLPSSDASHQVIVFAFPSHGIFALGDQTSTIASSAVTYWGAQWSASNSLSGGGATASFKGFAASTSSTPPGCGGTWSTGPGNSAAPVDTVPAYMGSAVTTIVTKSGSSISGTITHIVVVKTGPGYSADPGHPGTGTVIATYC